MATSGEGTHLQNSRPRDGWRNTCKPEVKPGRKIRGARKRLQERIHSFDTTSAKARSGAKRPGSMKCK